MSAPFHRRVELAVVLVAFVYLGWQTAYRAGLSREPGKVTHTDVFTFLEGADALASGTSPFGLREREHGYPYVYPPLPAVVFLPLRGLGRVGAAIAWYLISCGVFAAGVVSLRRALDQGDQGEHRDDHPWLPLLLVALPLASGLERGQLNPALAGLVALGAAALVKKREALSGAALAASVALKATPVLALAALVRRPRATAAAALALVFLLVLLPAPFLGLRGSVQANLAFADQMGLRYLHDPASATLTEGVRDYAVSEREKNQSLLAVMHRTRLGTTSAYRPVALVLALIIIGGTLALIVSIPKDADPRRLVAGVGLGASVLLVVAPIAWHWHHVVLYVPLVAIQRSRWLVLFAALEVLHFAWKDAQPFGPLALGTLLVLVLCGVCTRPKRVGDTKVPGERTTVEGERSPAEG